MKIKDITKGLYFVHSDGIYEKISNRNSGVARNIEDDSVVQLDIMADVEIIPKEDLFFDAKTLSEPLKKDYSSTKSAHEVFEKIEEKSPTSPFSAAKPKKKAKNND